MRGDSSARLFGQAPPAPLVVKVHEPVTQPWWLDPPRDRLDNATKPSSVHYKECEAAVALCKDADACKERCVRTPRAAETLKGLVHAPLTDGDGGRAARCTARRWRSDASENAARGRASGCGVTTPSSPPSLLPVHCVHFHLICLCLRFSTQPRR